MAFFDLVLQTESSLHPGSASAYVSSYTGAIRCARPSDGKICRVGKVLAHRIHTDLAWRDDASIVEACSAHSRDLQRVYRALFDAEEDDLRLGIRSLFDVASSDVLVLDHVVIHPRWRGVKLGLLAVRRLIDLLGGGCGLVVARFAPLSPEAAALHGVPLDWVPQAAGRHERREALAKLRRYFRRLGFERIHGTRLHGVSTAWYIPSLAELLRPGI